MVPVLLKLTRSVAAGGRRLVLALLLVGVSGVLAQDAPRVPVSERIMHWTPEDIKRIMREHHAAPQFPTAQQIAVSGIHPNDVTTSVNLYPLLDNIPADRNQGSCGDCWAWGCTGTMEIALNVQNGIRDRLSVQFINSCDPYKSCCGAGGFADFRDFYRYEGFAIPWSNPNANWSSGGGSCISCGTIGTNPRYPINNIDYYAISTGSDQAASIANVKAALNQNKGLYFFFYLPTSAAWTAFDNFFFQQAESVVWNDYYCGTPSDGGSGGHVVLCLGYYDDGGANRYWIMLNSWGPTSQRPTGFFHVAMDLDYTCSENYSFGFQAINIGFNLAPVITSQPQSRTNLQGSTAAFSIATAPGTPLTYQWQKNGTNLTNGGNIGGATSATLTLSNVSPKDAATYTVALSYGTGTTNSAPATLAVLVPPSIVTQPQSLDVPEGSSATFTVSATGTTPLSYQWQFDGININGTLSSYTLGNLHTNKAGDYSVIVTNGAGAVTSSVATLTVLVPPAIVSQPQSQTINQGSSATFSVTATGTTPLSYQWQFNGTNVSGTLSSYSLGNVRTNKAGNYTVIVSNGAGVVTSAVATLTVLAPSAAQPGQFDLITRLTNGTVQLCMTGTPGSSYVLESTTNWLNWASLWTNSSTDGHLQCTDSSATNAGQLFYRLRLGL